MSGELRRLDGTEGLSRKERRELEGHETTIRKAMQSAGAKAGDALRAIRDQRLYRATHGSFEDYCIDVWGFSRRTGDRMIQVAAEAAIAKAEAKRLRDAEKEAITAGQHESRASQLPPVTSQREAAKRAAARRQSKEAHDGSTVDGNRGVDAAPVEVAGDGQGPSPAPPRPSPPRRIPPPVGGGGGQAGRDAQPAGRDRTPSDRERTVALNRAHEETPVAVVSRGITADELMAREEFWRQVRVGWQERNGVAPKPALNRRDVTPMWKGGKR